MSPRRYILDTDVISETARPKPAPAVMSWLASEPTFALSAVTAYELSRGVEALAAGRRRRFLELWLGRVLDGSIEILAFDQDAALAAARLERDARTRGAPIDTRDLFILATAKVRGLGIATRNLSHFRGHGVPVYDPFDSVNAI